jgi:hypothetical protein
MSNESVSVVAVPPAAVSNGQPSPSAALFQKAHTKMVTLARVDEQLSGLLEQRRKLADELKSVQTQINDEFERVMREAQAAPARMLAQFGDGAALKAPKRNGAPLRMEVAEAV